MSNPTGLRRAFSPKRSLRLEPQASEGSGLSRISLTGSRKRTRKQSKLQSPEAPAEVDPQKFYEDWKLYPQDEVRVTPKCSQNFQSLHMCLLHHLTIWGSLHGLNTARPCYRRSCCSKCMQAWRKRVPSNHSMVCTLRSIGWAFAIQTTWDSPCAQEVCCACLQICTCYGAFCAPEVMI